MCDKHHDKYIKVQTPKNVMKKTARSQKTSRKKHQGSKKQHEKSSRFLHVLKVIRIRYIKTIISHQNLSREMIGI